MFTYTTSPLLRVEDKITEFDVPNFKVWSRLSIPYI